MNILWNHRQDMFLWSTWQIPPCHGEVMSCNSSITHHDDILQCVIMLGHNALSWHVLIGQGQPRVEHTSALASHLSNLSSHCRDHSGYGLSQWEMMLQCNIVSHWMNPYPECRDHSGNGLSQWETRYIVTSSLIGWAHTQNDPYTVIKFLAALSPNQHIALQLVLVQEAHCWQLWCIQYLPWCYLPQHGTIFIWTWHGHHNGHHNAGARSTKTKTCTDSIKPML